MNAIDYCVVVRLLLLPDRIVVTLNQHLPAHAFFKVDQLESYRLYHLIDRQMTRQRGRQLEYCLRVTDDRTRYTRVLDDLQTRIVDNLKGESVLFVLVTDPTKPLRWSVDRPVLALV